MKEGNSDVEESHDALSHQGKSKHLLSRAITLTNRIFRGHEALVEHHIDSILFSRI